MNPFKEIERLITEHGSAAILRERLALAADKYAALEEENQQLAAARDGLVNRLTRVESENNALKAAKHRSSVTPEGFDDTTHNLLGTFFDLDGLAPLSVISLRADLARPSLSYHLDLLQDAGFVERLRGRLVRYAGAPRPEPKYSITAKGRKYAVKMNIRKA